MRVFYGIGLFLVLVLMLFYFFVYPVPKIFFKQNKVLKEKYKYKKVVFFPFVFFSVLIGLLFLVLVIV